MTVKMWPYEFVEFETRRFCGRAWFRASTDFFDEVEATAAIHATVSGKEIDIIGCSVMPSGRIGGRERVGIRVRP